MLIYICNKVGTIVLSIIYLNDTQLEVSVFCNNNNNNEEEKNEPIIFLYRSFRSTTRKLMNRITIR